MRRLASVPFSPYASPRYLKEHPREAGASLLPGDDLVALHESMDASPEGSWLQAHAPRQRVRVPSASIPGSGASGPRPSSTATSSSSSTGALRNAERLRIVSRFVLECLEGRGARQAGRASGG